MEKDVNCRMKLIDRIKKSLSPKAPEPETAPTSKDTRIKKTCKSCGKTFTVDPSWEFIPNFCKDCRMKMTEEKEAKQRAGAPREIKRKCKECGNFFTFSSTMAHYPQYCNNCRKRHQAKMKEKYARKGRTE